MTAQALPGMEAGTRAERVEWGLRQTVGNILMRKGEVASCVDEGHARRCAGKIEYGWRDTEVVRRTVVTYTTLWELAAERTGDGDEHRGD